MSDAVSFSFVSQSSREAERSRRVLFVGRFNPLHKGHVEIMKHILAAHPGWDLIVAIGSAQFSHTLRDPFTAGERLQMLHETIIDENLPRDRIYLVTIPDIERNSLWVSHVETYCPRFSVVYSNNPLVYQLFIERGYEVKPLKFVRRKEYQGTEIRRRMIETEPWEHLVPPSVVRVIKEIKGVERLQTLNRSDTP